MPNAQSSMNAQRQMLNGGSYMSQALSNSQGKALWYFALSIHA
jgi:hypothetical protein